MPKPNEDSWSKVDAAMTSIVQTIHRRSPRARVVLVDYLTVLLDDALCAQTPVSVEAAGSARAAAARLSQLTSEVARRNGAEVLAASGLSREHDAYAEDPWMTGFTPSPRSGSFVPNHPNLAGMTAVAEELERHLRRKSP